jgi:ribosomal protein S18 acetylase RimI-like enzyme
VPDTPEFEIRPMLDRKALDELLRLRWSDGTVSVRGKLIGVMDVEALGAYVDGRLQGVATWIVEESTLYLATLNNVTDRRGVSSALLEAMIALGREKGFRVLRALISNDNTRALRFYQRRGFRIVAVHIGIVDMMRRLKPAIPERGFDGILMRDEIELEMVL